MTFRGLTWDHPRGYDALAEAERQVNAGRKAQLIHWDKQPLEGFESAPIAKLAADYDLLVLDHPHIGEAVVHDCLLALEDLYPAEQLAQWQAQTVGPALTSYVWQGKTWALPLDVATQVMVRRADRLAETPASWEEVCQIADHLPVAQSLGGPHALLSLFSMVAGLGGSVGGPDLLSEAEGCEALALMHRLYEKRPLGSEALNPIALSETMAGTEDIALVPLIFGYVTYARSGAGQLTFSDTIGVGPKGTGGVLGGTGIGFCKPARPSQELLDHIAWLMQPETQRGLIPAFGGQPSARQAWTDPQVNAAWRGFYDGSLKTAENALMRPRFDGYVAFQTMAADRVRQSLNTRENEETALSALRTLWKEACAKARGPLNALEDKK